MRSKLQERSTLEKQLQELKEANQTYEYEICDASNKLQPLQSNLDSKYANKTKIAEQRDANEELTKIKLNEIKDNGNRIMEQTKKINRLLFYVSK